MVTSFEVLVFRIFTLTYLKGKGTPGVQHALQGEKNREKRIKYV